MKYLNLTLKTPAENLACDEALLNVCENGLIQDEILRFWEPKQHFVVLGYSNRVKLEVNDVVARNFKIPIFRRSSGGGTVLQGPGCLNYSLILRIDRSPKLSNLIKTNHYVLSRHQKSLTQLLGQPVHIQGISDLTVDNFKFSGNAQRRKKKFLLYHGTLLLKMDLNLIETVLKMPPKEPDYRKERRHLQFVTNIDCDRSEIIRSFKKVWRAEDSLEMRFGKEIKTLAKEVYSSRDWNYKF